MNDSRSHRLAHEFAHDFAPRAAARSKASIRARLQRLRERAFFLTQIAVAAGLAWFVAQRVVGHQMPFFAPVTAAICLGMSYGQRLRRAYEVVVGVALGVFVGDLFVHFFGTGVWQIALVCVIAMSVATLLGAGVLMTTQAGVQSVIILGLVGNTGTAVSRWLDAVIGGGVAIALTLIAPAAPIHKPRQQAATVLTEVGGLLGSTVSALRLPVGSEQTTALTELMDRARGSQALLTRLESVAAEGLAVVRLSLLRRRDLPGVQEINDLLVPLDRALRNTRVLIRRVGVISRTRRRVPDPYVDLLERLASTTNDMARVLHERSLPANARQSLVAISTDAGAAPAAISPDGEVVRAQIRSICTDLIMLTGLTYDEAFALIPRIEETS